MDYQTIIICLCFGIILATLPGWVFALLYRTERKKRAGIHGTLRRFIHERNDQEIINKDLKDTTSRACIEKANLEKRLKIATEAIDTLHSLREFDAKGLETLRKLRDGDYKYRKNCSLLVIVDTSKVRSERQKIHRWYKAHDFSNIVPGVWEHPNYSELKARVLKHAENNGYTVYIRSSRDAQEAHGKIETIQNKVIDWDKFPDKWEIGQELYVPDYETGKYHLGKYESKSTDDGWNTLYFYCDDIKRILQVKASLLLPTRLHQFGGKRPYLPGDERIKKILKTQE